MANSTKVETSDAVICGGCGLSGPKIGWFYFPCGEMVCSLDCWEEAHPELPQSLAVAWRPGVKPKAAPYVAAAEAMDWPQVVLNGGPPCFHLCEDGRFCGRAQRWDGHQDLHTFVSLADLLRALTT